MVQTAAKARRQFPEAGHWLPAKRRVQLLPGRLTMRLQALEYLPEMFRTMSFRLTNRLQGWQQPENEESAFISRSLTGSADDPH